MRSDLVQYSEINIADLDKADVLAALYNASRPLGMGFLHYDPTPMTREEAVNYLKDNSKFDYLKGRVMKIHLDTDILVPTYYDRDNGPEAARKVIDTLRATKRTDAGPIMESHESGKIQSAAEARISMREESEWEGQGIFKLGFAEQKENLEPAIQKALKKKRA